MVLFPSFLLQLLLDTAFFPLLHMLHSHVGVLPGAVTELASPMPAVVAFFGGETDFWVGEGGFGRFCEMTLKPVKLKRI